ncbi:ficolin-2-like [Saccoglossus kowalevskii]
MVRDCYEGFLLGVIQDDVYYIQLEDATVPYQIRCEMDPASGGGGGWTVIQRRFDGSVNFYDTWDAYKNGMGDPLTGEYYFGNDKIHEVTSQKTYQLRVDMTEWDSTAHTVTHDSFAVGNETSKYILSVGNKIEGDLNDALSFHSGAQFSTTDQDNDNNVADDCADLCKGGWWYKKDIPLDMRCYTSHLNSNYDPGGTMCAFERGIVYYTDYSDPNNVQKICLKTVTMKLRP